MTVLATVVVLGVLIFVHELGHFWAAKSVGIEVQRFSIGLGPRVFGFQRGETEYVVSAIPLGGYVKMGGMDDEVMDRIEGAEGEGTAREPSDRDFDAKPIWARTLVISAGVIMNMLFAFGVYTFLAAQYGVQEAATTRVGRVVVESLPPGTEELGSVASGSRIVGIGGELTEHWGQVVSGLFERAPGPVRIDLEEPTASIEIRIPVSEEERRALVGSVLMWLDAGIGYAEPGSPAASAGLEVGDLVTAVGNEPTADWWTFRDEIAARPGERVELTIEREGSELVRTITLDAVEESNPNGSVTVVGRAGVLPPPIDVVYRDVSLVSAVQTGYRDTKAVTFAIAGFLKQLVTGGVSPRSVGSIVTIGSASGQAAAAGLDPFLRFMALFSVNLAILNMLPIPVLDGGHLVFLAIEAVRGGRGLSVEQRLKWSNVGFVIIVGIMVWALSNDIMRLLGI
jgi:regulator of sigma E protease